MKTTILFIRHGQTDWNVAGRWQGFTDIPLNEVGRAQAQMLTERIADWPIKAVYSSDLSRAAETGKAVAERLGIDLLLDPAWRERGLGALEGLTRDEILEQFPYLSLPRTFIEAPGGESYLDLKHRVLQGYKRVLKEYSGEMVAVVSHGGTLRLIISHILELPERIYAPFTLDGNTGISRVVVNEDGHARLVTLNDTAHLE